MTCYIAKRESMMQTHQNHTIGRQLGLTICWFVAYVVGGILFLQLTKVSTYIKEFNEVLGAGFVGVHVVFGMMAAGVGIMFFVQLFHLLKLVVVRSKEAFSKKEK